MSSPPPALIAQRPFALLWLARVAATVGYQMMMLLFAWELYALTGSALDLGLVGLIQFVPAVVLTLVIGHIADRYERRQIVRLAQGVYALIAFAVLWTLARHTLSRDLLFVAVFALGTARAFEMPTIHALVPALVPEPLMPRAIAAWTLANQTAVVCGPVLGGMIYALSPFVVTALCGIFFLTAMLLVSLVRPGKAEKMPGPPPLTSILAGLRFILVNRRLSGIITLDLFVVILGGATALLPIFARDILHAGPTGLGLLRSAPAIGALITSAALSKYPIERHIGRRMFQAVAVYGIATLCFGLSTWLPFSLLALAVLGAADAVSVVIRFSLVQIETPDAMRGRVSAINYLFVGSSNTLGEFESGAVAAWLGAVGSVLIGGAGALLVACVWRLLYPELRAIDRFQPPRSGAIEERNACTC